MCNIISSDSSITHLKISPRLREGVSRENMPSCRWNATELSLVYPQGGSWLLRVRAIIVKTVEKTLLRTSAFFSPAVSAIAKESVSSGEPRDSSNKNDFELWAVLVFLELDVQWDVVTSHFVFYSKYTDRREPRFTSASKNNSVEPCAERRNLQKPSRRTNRPKTGDYIHLNGLSGSETTPGFREEGAGWGDRGRG